MHPDRWEHGSDFHYLHEAGIAALPWTDACLVGSGRDAFRVLLAWGRALGWRRLFVPSYYCDEVLQSIAQVGLPVVTYVDSPERDEAPIDAIESIDTGAGEGDAIVRVNYFGLRAAPKLTAPRGAILIDDHTHDPFSPWAFAGDADYAVASLRKTLPLPDGGVVWSPRKKPLPAEPSLTSEHARASGDRLAAMLLKERYLAGSAVEKSAFRDLAIAGERAIGAGSVSAITPFSRALLPAMPTREWREARRANFETLAAAVANVTGSPPPFRLFVPSPSATPYAATLLFDSTDSRELVRNALISARIYPAILWPQPASSAPLADSDTSIADRLLTIHCDQRYTVTDMERVGEALRRIGVGKR